VNLIADKPVVKELIQHELNTANIQQELRLLVEEGNYRSTMLNAYKELEKNLGGVGASRNVAIEVLKSLGVQ
jgi:lipid-A-disaccharide synthase